MAQLRTLDYRAPESTRLLNEKFVKLLPYGVYTGFDLIPGVNNTYSLQAGTLLTKEGVLIEETVELANSILVPTGFDRTYRIVCRHQYSSLNIPAEYHCIDDSNPQVSTDTILSKVTTAATDTVATQFLLEPVKKVILDNLRKVIETERATLDMGTGNWEVLEPVVDVIAVTIDGAEIFEGDDWVWENDQIKLLITDFDPSEEELYVTYTFIDPSGVF